VSLVCSLCAIGFKTYSLSMLTMNLVMDKIAKRPRGFAFIRYETEEEAQKAIEGMHGKVCSAYHFLRKL